MRTRQYPSVLISFVAGFLALGPAFVIEKMFQHALPFWVEIGAVGVVEELLKGGISLLIMRANRPRILPVATALGFAASETALYVFSLGVVWHMRIGVFLFHILTGVILARSVRNKRAGAGLTLNIALHWLWNLIAAGFI